MPKPRNLYRTVQMKKASQTVEDLLYTTAARQLRIGWRQVSGRVRRLSKAETMDDVWEDWTDEWVHEFERNLDRALSIFAGVEEDWYAKHDVVVNYDSYNAVRAYIAGSKITKTPDEIKRKVSTIITEWFTSEEPIDHLINQLAPTFGDSRARLIAINETTACGSWMTKDIMRSVGLEKWTWETRKDDIVCPICGDLDGKVFTSHDPMPPDGSHIGCRCGAAPLLPGMEQDWSW